MENKHTPVPLASVGDLPAELTNTLRERGIHSCEQLFAALCLVAGGSDSELARILGPDRANDLRSRLEALLPAETRTSLAKAAETRWTEVRPLGVPSEPPKETRRGKREDAHE